MKIPRKLQLMIFASVLALGSVVVNMPKIASAQGTCTVDSLNPHDTTTDTDFGFDFFVSSTETMQWVRVGSPNGNVQISDASSPDWSAQASTTQAIFSQGSVDPGNDTDLHVVAHVANYFPPASWSVQVSPNADGSNPISCGGDTQITVSDTNPPIISSVTSTIVAGNVIISWDTDKPADSEVVYGTSTSYGHSNSDSSFVESHSLTLKGLTPNTAYHYQVTSVDEAGNSTSSGDNTFMTPPAALFFSTLPSPSGKGSTIIPQKNKKNPFADKIAPVITLAPFARIEKQAPTITGTVTDNGSVANIEYSLDDGKDWLPVDNAPTLNTAKTAFAFTPVDLQDGTYLVRVEATDGAGNKTVSAPKVLVIDQYPPQVGGSVVAIGPQVLTPDATGVIHTASGVVQRITVQALSGATSVNLIARHPGDNHESNTFQLTQDPVSGLWSGIMQFDMPGVYQVTAHGVDGAGNTTDRLLQTVSVLSPARVFSIRTGKTLGNATASVYYRNADGDWVVWDGAAYGQANPQVSRNGAISCVLPAGTYYLKVVAPGFEPLVSRIFTVTRPTVVDTPLGLHPSPEISLGFFKLRLPSLAVTSLEVNPKADVHRLPSIATKLSGQPFPNFNLTTTDGQAVNPLDLRGKMGVITILGTWAPTTTEQLAALADLQANHNVTVLPLFVQESTGRVQVFLQTSGYHISALVDPHGSLVNSLMVGQLPSHYFLDRTGHIKRVVVGVLSKKEILTELVGQ